MLKVQTTAAVTDHICYMKKFIIYSRVLSCIPGERAAFGCQGLHPKITREV